MKPHSTLNVNSSAARTIVSPNMKYSLLLPHLVSPKPPINFSWNDIYNSVQERQLLDRGEDRIDTPFGFSATHSNQPSHLQFN
jgi:hypothetical protein